MYLTQSDLISCCKRRQMLYSGLSSDLGKPHLSHVNMYFDTLMGRRDHIDAKNNQRIVSVSALIVRVLLSLLCAIIQRAVIRLVLLLKLESIVQRHNRGRTYYCKTVVCYSSRHNRN